MEKMVPFLKQALRFGIVGLLNTALDLALYFVLTRWVGMFAALPVAAKVVSYSAGLLNSFFLNRSWTFHSQARVQHALPRFVLFNLVGLLLNAWGMSIGLHTLALPEVLTLALATATSLAWNFFASKYLVFSRKAALTA